MELKCSNCGIPISPGDIFCRKCGLQIRPNHGAPSVDDSFSLDVHALLKTLIEFRAWVDQRKKVDVRFMKNYKQRIEDEITPPIRQFKEKYGQMRAGRPKQFELILRTFASFKGPLSFMETRLRPSVGMGVWQERWMRAKAVDDYLKQCCQQADRHIDELMKKMK